MMSRVARSVRVLGVLTPLLVVAPLGAQAERVDSLVAAGRLQEAAWAAREEGDTARAETILARLDSILRSEPRAAAPMGMDSQGVSYTFRLEHGGVRSLFKVDGSDIFCPHCGSDREVAVYRIDRLLGIDLTPMTIGRTLVVRGDTLYGSAMYFMENAVTPAEAGADKTDRLRFLDAVIGNTDRHRANWLIAGGRPVAIDHNRAFQYRPVSRPKTCWETEVDSLRLPADLGTPVDRYRTLPDDSLRAVVQDVLAPELVQRFVTMRPRILARLDARLREPGASLPLRDCRFED